MSPKKKKKKKKKISQSLSNAFHRKVWDTHTGECLNTLQHSHIVRTVAFPVQFSPQVLATGGAERKLRIFDLTNESGYEIGPGVHQGTIKSIIWNQDYNILSTAAEDQKIRWWDLRSRNPIVEYPVEGPIGSYDVNSRPNDSTGILSIAAGRSVHLFDGLVPGRLLRKIDFPYEVASAAVNDETARLVTGSPETTWARVYDLHTDEELGIAFFPFCF